MNVELHSYQEKYRWIATKISLVKEIVPLQYLDSEYVRTYLYEGSHVDKVFTNIFFSWLLNTKNNDQRDGKYGEFVSMPIQDSLCKIEPNSLIRNHKIFNFIINSQKNTERGFRYAEMDGYYTVVNTLASLIVRSQRVKVILSNSFGKDVSQIDNFNQLVDEVVEDKHLHALKKCAHIVLENTFDQLVSKAPFFFEGMSLVANHLSNGISICRLILDAFDGMSDDYIDELSEINDFVFQQEFIGRVVTECYLPRCREFNSLNALIEELRENALESYKYDHPEYEDIEKLSDLPETADDVDWDGLYEMDAEVQLPEIAVFEVKPELASKLIKMLEPNLPEEYELLYARGTFVIAKYFDWGSMTIDTWASDAGIFNTVNNYILIGEK